MDQAQVFIFAAGWIFFAVWGMVLAAVSVIAFGREMFAPSERREEKPPKARVVVER